MEQPERLSIEEFTERLADLLDQDPDQLKADAEAFEIEPPWEAEVE